MQKKLIKKLLIANRGEIACRIIRTCRSLGIQTVAVYSESDRNSLHCKLADEALPIGGSQSSESYLNPQRIIEAARLANADAIHPGYGFLSENADFARLCASNNIIFVGPLPESIESIGDKSAAKKLLRERGGGKVPLIPGYDGQEQSIEGLVAAAQKVGFPVLIKASAGGGGKGMRVVRSVDKLKEEIESAKGEALRSFNSDHLLIERYFENVKHVEVQIMGDQHGNVYHCFERECSVQRRHQKVIEETPSPVLDKELRAQMTSTAVLIGKLINYHGAGTVEFILEPSTRKFYFLEVNTRLQVEHPITEAITGLDLVALQIHVAEGKPLSGLGLENLHIDGHAIEVRLYAEDPNNNFFPCTGRVLLWREMPPNGTPYPRYDTGIQTGSEISVFYDPMIAKITTHAPTREQAILMMQQALHGTVCLGLVTNKAFLLKMLDTVPFRDGSYTTRMIDNMSKSEYVFNPQSIHNVSIPGLPIVPADSVPELKWIDSVPHRSILPSTNPNTSANSKTMLSVNEEALFVSTLWFSHRRVSDRKQLGFIRPGYRNVWWRGQREQVSLLLDHSSSSNNQNSGESGDGGSVMVEYVMKSAPGGGWKYYMRWVKPVQEEKSIGKGERKKTAVVTVGERVGPWMEVDLLKAHLTPDTLQGHLSVYFSGRKRTYFLVQPPMNQHHTSEDTERVYIHQNAWPRQFCVQRTEACASQKESEDDHLSAYTSSMPCRVLKLLVSPNTTVNPGDAVMTVESMKMESRIYSKHRGIVKFRVKEGQVVEAGTLMLDVEEQEENKEAVGK